MTAAAYADNNPQAYNPFAPPPKEKTAYEWLHPPLAKLIQALSIKAAGDTPIGWRLPSVIFGTAIIPAVFLFSFLLFGPVVAVFSTLVISFENLNLVMSRIAMNDIFVTFFILSSFIFTVLYRRSGKTRYLILTAIFLGLSASTKWTGIYAIGIVFGYLVFYDARKRSFKFRHLLLLILPAAIYLASYGQFWLQGHTVLDFINLHKQIWWYQNRRDLVHPYGTTPIFCAPKGLVGDKYFCPWVWDVRPTYFSYEQYGENSGYIHALGNPLVFWFGSAAVLYFVVTVLHRKKSEGLILVLLGYFAFWVPWVFSPRILFLHHYLPSIPFLATCLGLGIAKIWQSKFKLAAILIVGLIALAFFYFYPITSGYPIKTASIEGYMWFKTWR